MAFVHGKSTYFSIDGVDLSAFTNSIAPSRESDKHDVTCYGQNGHRYQGGLYDGTVTVQGIYDDGATGPAEVLEPMLTTTQPVIIRSEGTGTGKPERAFDAVVVSYEETLPVAGMVTWQCELQIDGTVTKTVQV